MSVKIKNRCLTPISPRIEGFIHSLLGKVPQEHLVGLEAIILVDQIVHKASQKRMVRGVYRQKWQQRPATIELAPGLIYRGMPNLFFHLPFLARFALAGVLYHELGHHYQLQLTHGVTKEEREVFAERYKMKMLKQTFSRWLVIVLPIWRLVSWLTGRRRRKVAQ